MERLFKLRPDLVCYAKLAQRKVGYIAGQVELTSECSQHCLYCDSWRAHTKGTIKGTLTYSDIIHLIQQLNAMPTFEHLTFTGGDPQNWVEPNSKFDFEALLSLLRTQKLCYTLQVNTALVKPIKAEIWREALSRVRVSLDSVRRETYKKLRGDGRDPEEIIERMEELAHPGISTMTCVSEGNIDEVPEIIERLYRMKIPPRKAMFLAVLGTKVKPDFWEKYNALKKITYPENMQLSFQEDAIEVREFCNSKEAESLPCYVGGVTFHIKCNGDVYGCCLCGGEAIKTQEAMKLGNIRSESISKIQRAYKPTCHYKKGSPCSEACQWKQLAVNRMVHAAKDVTLTMP